MGNVCSCKTKKKNDTLIENEILPGIKETRNLRKIDNIHKYYDGMNDESNLLGKGAFGKVYRATRIPTSSEYAVKIIPKEKLKENKYLPACLCNELNIGKKNSHPYIVDVYETLIDDKNFYIASELLEGDELYKRLMKMDKPISNENAAFVIH